MLKSANLAVKFLLELAAFAALAYWGATIGHGAWAVLAAIAAPVAAVLIWGAFCAPRARRRLPTPARVPRAQPQLGADASGFWRVPYGVLWLDRQMW